MTGYSRRNFIKQLGAFAGIALAGRNAFPATFFSGSDDAAAFNFLVVGDSMVWGQGLREEDKFYHLTGKWLESEVFNNTRQINLLVKAHSGASINLRRYETDALESAEIGEDKFFHREINLSFPSIRTQVDIARAKYENPESVDLIMLSGGITDVRITEILNPMKSNAELKSDIVKHCNEKMFELLDHTAAEFPKALIVVVGYYPFLSKHTPASRIFDGVLEMYNFPRRLKLLVNNPLKRRTLSHYRRKMIERSMIWAQDSTAELQKAIDRLNAKFGNQRAVFVESPIGEENTIGAKKALIYDIGPKGRAMDEMAAERKSICRETLDELREATDLKLRSRTCELATVGHPNPQGSKAIAEAIQNRLKPFFFPET